MFEQIKEYLAPPAFEKDEQQVPGTLLYATLLTLQGLFLTVPLLFALLQGGTIFAPEVVAGFLLALLAAGLLVTMKRGYLSLVSWLTVLLLLLSTTGTLFAFNGVRDSTVAMLFFAVVIGGLLLSKRNAIAAMTLITVLLLTFLYAAERQGFVNYDVEPLHLGHLFWPVLTVSLIGALVGFTMRNLNHALERARASEQAAAEVNEQLEAMNVALEARVTARTRALQLTGNVSRRLSTILDQDELVQAVVNQLQQAFNYYHVHIYLLDESGETLRMVGGTGEAGRTMLERGHTIALGQGLVGRAASTNLPVLVSDVSQEPGWLSNPLLPKTRTEVAVPIARGDEVIGVLDVQHSLQGALTGEDVELIQSLTNQIAVALQNARLYQQAQARAEQEQLLNTINQRIQSAADVDQAMQVAVRELGRALDSQPARVRLYPVQGTPIGERPTREAGINPGGS